MKVMVTGGAGYIGSCVVEELLKNNHEPIVFDSFYWGKESLKSFSDKIKIIEGDCRNSRDVIYALEGVDAVIHLAGIVGAPACYKNPRANFSINVESTRTLVNCCTDPELDLIRDFIYGSSCSAYGNVKGIYEEVTEDTEINPLSLYSYSKVLSENILLQKCKEISHFHPTILRLTTVFGWSPRPRLDLVTNLFAYKAWKDKKITIYGDGSQYRSLVHVRDVAKAFVCTLEAPRFMRDGKIFHVGEEANNMMIKEIASIVQQEAPGTEIEIKEEQGTDRRDYRIICQKFKNTIGWQARYTVKDGIREMIDKFNTLDLDWDSDNYRNDTYKYF